MIEPLAAATIPLFKSSFSIPLIKRPALSPASPSLSVFWNISTPVIVVVMSEPIPISSTSSPTLILPDSILPVPTVPLPVILNTSSTGIKNGLSSALSG